MLKRIILLCGVALLFTSPVKADEYEDCMKTNSGADDKLIAVCYNKRTDSLMQEIKSEHEGILKEPRFSKWSGAENMRTGNFRQMYENWVLYREKFCSAYVVSMQEYMGSDEYNLAECMKDMTEDYIVNLRKLLRNANSVVD